jgi:hypothetical protein
MKKLTENYANVGPTAVTGFSDSVFYYSLGATNFANVPVPPDAGYVDITASQFVAVTPATISGAPANTPAKTAGSQTATFSSAVTGSTATGLANNATVYTATFYVDGTAVNWSDAGSNLQTYAALVSSFNSTLSTAGSAAITGGNIVVTSATTGAASSVAISSAPAPSGVFPSLALFASFAAPVPGALTSSNAEVVLTATKQLTAVNGTPITTIGVYAPTGSTIVSLAFYK